MPSDPQPTNLWMIFVLTSIVSWGLYGILLHTGQLEMADAQNGRYKAFLWVGIAYILVAVIGPVVMLLSNGASWAMPVKGITWSLIAGVAGAIGAFGVLLAFGAKGHPAVVMSLVFAGAPVVNALVSLTMSPPPGGFSAIRWQFLAGIVMAACGGMLVTLYKPPPGKPHGATPPAAGENR